jgi:hypothetical protein
MSDKQHMQCTYAGCEDDATRIMAMPPRSVPCYYVAPYCAEHADGVKAEGGLPVAGPALSEAAAKIEGIR